jgi:hypothetical protein
MPDFTDISDVLNLSSVLRKASVNRVAFDPVNPLHIESLETFIQTGNWGDVQFYCESPYTDVPMTVLMKFASKTLNVSRESAEERAVRLAVMVLVPTPPEETREQKAARLAASNKRIFDAAAVI